MKTVRVRQHQAHRRVGKIDGVEIHRGSTPEKLGFEYGELVTPNMISEYESDYPHTFTFVAREEPDQTEVDSILLGEIRGDEAELHMVESFKAGFGRKIVTAFEKWAKQRGARKVVLAMMIGSEGFWKRIGYTLYKDPADQYNNTAEKEL